MTAAQERRWQAELEIIQKLGKVPSSRKMQELLKKDYGMTVNHNTVNSDLKQDLETLTTTEYENQKTGILTMLEKEIGIAHNIAMTESDNELRLKAMNTVSKLSKTKSDILIKFRKANAQLTSAEKPQINVFLGKPKEVDLKKIKDGENEK